MLIAFPVDYSHHSSRFPWAVTLLSVLLCIIYFTYQANDQTNQQKALEYYFQSKLYQLELPGYVDYLTQKSYDENITILKPNTSKMELYWLSRGDAEFQQLLSDGKIVKTTHPFYWEWYTRHRYYQYLLNLDTTNLDGFKSAAPSIDDALTSIFLHGSFLHLLGNVLFLIFIGRYVEAYLGGHYYINQFCGARNGIGRSLLFFNSANTVSIGGGIRRYRRVNGYFYDIVSIRKIVLFCECFFLFRHI